MSRNALVNMALARKYVLRSHFSGFPKREALEIVEETLPPIKMEVSGFRPYLVPRPFLGV